MENRFVADIARLKAETAMLLALPKKERRKAWQALLNRGNESVLPPNDKLDALTLACYSCRSITR